ncbi:hypothetical protein EDM56_04735 [Brevibacillus fluminis]|uniref:HutD family protein n=1 Tax=Brevibacillus fluminis TaxID=511487 RepID=A0A3M8DTE1_9BACL|nr:HutD family protein [Brevibacillus fluminis]RNB91352.1 hypothetical protein EDM56_04735 [Brevibacillus fluminis]
MNDSITICRKQDQPTTQWSGGLTTQLAIFPKDADYSRRDFLWRLSTAKVEAEESVFTHLPGFWRHLMVLEGELLIEHEGHHRIALQPFQQDSFNGGWTTRSKGKVRDFNLMLAVGCRGALTASQIKTGVHLETVGNREHPELRVDEAFYCLDGTITITRDDKHEVKLQEGDLLIFSNMSTMYKITIANRAETTVTMIRATIVYERKTHL